MANLDIIGLLVGAGIKNVRDGGKEVSGSCPMHLHRIGRTDSHASWSINKTTFLHHCFSCGYSGTLTGLLIDVQGYAPDDIETLVLSTSFTGKMSEVRAAAPEKVVTDWELSNVLEPVPERLLSFRRLRPDAANAYGVRWDPKVKSWVLPVRSPDGVLLGAQYRQKGAVINQPTGLEKSTTLFGFYEMRLHNRITLVESPLDAVRLYGLGIPAVASFGAWVSSQQVDLLSRTYSTVVIALDNDSVGMEAMSQVAHQLRRRGTASVPFRYDGLVTAEGNRAKDVGDVEDDDLLLKNFRDSVGRPSLIPPPKKKLKPRHVIV